MISLNQQPPKMDISNCFVCACRSILDPFRVFYPLKSYCPHSSLFHSNKPYFKISKPSELLMALLLIFFMVSTMRSFPHLSDVWRTDRSLCLILIADQFIIVSTCILLTLVWWKLRFELEESAGYLEIFANRQFFLLKDIIDAKDMRHLLLARNIVTVTIFCGAVVNAVGIYGVSYDNLPWNLARKLATSVVLCFPVLHGCAVYPKNYRRR
jgi:hypothetical protein